MDEEVRHYIDARPAAARAEYDHGWPLVLGRYQEHAGIVR